MAQEEMKDKMQNLRLESSGEGEEAAQQALKEKYEEVVSEKEREKSSTTGMEDAKAMLRDEYEDAKKSLQRKDGKPEPADANEAARLANEGKADKLEQGAEGHEAMGTLDEAKSNLASGGVQSENKETSNTVGQMFSSGGSSA